MSILSNVLSWLLPWEFSPTVLLCTVVAATLFWLGTRRLERAGRPPGWPQRISFYVGLIVLYVPLQTHYDYLAQHMFWIHRLQHLLLHHVGPMLVAIAVPWETMAEGLPKEWRAPLQHLWRRRPVRATYGFIQHPVVASVLFVGLIYFWLWPDVHFTAMLNATDYKLMNWSMAVDGLLFWWLMLDPRTREEGAQMGIGARIPTVMILIVPQTLIGAYLSLQTKVIYDVYAVCGRLWPVSPVTDQQIGGLLTWIPSSMMSVIAAIILLRHWMVSDDRRLRVAATAAVTRR
jgi:putative membrane protein